MAAQLAAGVLSVRFCQVTIVPEVPEMAPFQSKVVKAPSWWQFRYFAAAKFAGTFFATKRSQHISTLEMFIRASIYRRSFLTKYIYYRSLNHINRKSAVGRHEIPLST